MLWGSPHAQKIHNICKYSKHCHKCYRGRYTWRSKRLMKTKHELFSSRIDPCDRVVLLTLNLWDPFRAFFGSPPDALVKRFFACHLRKFLYDCGDTADCSIPGLSSATKNCAKRREIRCCEEEKLHDPDVLLHCVTLLPLKFLFKLQVWKTWADRLTFWHGFSQIL